VAVVETDPYAEVKERLRTDFPFYASTQLKIIDRQKSIPFTLKPAQLRMWRALQEQRAAGRAMRLLCLKARKIGFSTEAQGIGLQRVTTRPNHNMLTVGHDSSTAQELFKIAEFMYAGLSDHEDMAFLKPAITHQRRQRELHFGEDSRQRLKGTLGLNSSMRVDTANEFEAGRGFTFHTLLLSEVAFWADLKRKLTALLNAVPHDDLDTLVILESTAQGHNYFKELWDAAEAGRNDYVCFFSPWFEDEKYRRKFANRIERDEFEADLGAGAWGEDEPDLETLIAESVRAWCVELDLEKPSDADLWTRVLEHLHWRRWAIENLAGGDLQTFNTEYPSTPAMAFSVASKNVFAPLALQKARRLAEVTDPDARELVFTTTKTQLRRGRHIAVDVPVAYETRERRAQARTDLFWRVWEDPKPKGQYIIEVDPAQDEENTSGEPDWTAVVIIDHHTGQQVAEMRTRSDKDLVAEQVYLICLHYTVKPNLPLLVVEMTGGYGHSLVNRVWKDYGYRNMYFRDPIDPRRREHSNDLVGFSTDRHTKPLLVDGAKELFREESHGLKSLLIVGEAEAYTRMKGGKTAAGGGAHDDLLTSWMVAQYVRQVKPPRKDRPRGAVTITRGVRVPTFGH
jgi:hypothetical protein